LEPDRVSVHLERVRSFLRADNQIKTSAGRTRVCWDNAAAESFFNTLENEMYYRQRFETRAKARFAVAEYIEIFYNRQRLHSHLGYRTPAEALADHQARAAALPPQPPGAIQDP
jgi:putative transposase